MSDSHNQSTRPDYERQDVVSTNGGGIGNGETSDPGYESDIPVNMLSARDFEADQLVSVYRTMLT
ncbi:MAG: hypothetical protein KJO98_00420, partial [Rhodothermia bacterium]|nr:hypothetical protein [Rhodothermia bacterium]